VSKLLAVAVILLALPALSAYQAAARLTGRVDASDGVGLRGARVSLLSADRQEQSFRNVADDEGIYELRYVPEGTYTLRLEAPGFAHADINAVSLRAGESTNVPPVKLDVTAPCRGAPQKLQLAAQAGALSRQVQSTVSDFRGKPLVSVRVILRDDSQVYSATTDSQGRFHIVGITPGVYGIQLRLRGYWDSYFSDLRVQAGFITSPGPFALERCVLGRCIPALRRRKIVVCE